MHLTATNILLLSAMTIWSLAWKGVSCWTAARKEQNWWFIALLLLNTIGVLDMIYLFFVARIQDKKKIDGVSESTPETK